MTPRALPRLKPTELLWLCLVFVCAARVESSVYAPAKVTRAPRTTLHALAMRSVRDLSNSPSVRLLPFGRSVEGRALPALVISDFSVKPEGKARVMVLAGQHGDEPTPVSALLRLSHRLASGFRPDLLSRCAVIMVPVVNPDGAEHSTRLTATGVDTNRDWLSLASPETQHVHRLITTWKPHILLDLHQWNDEPNVPGNEIEVAPCFGRAQSLATGRLASLIARRAGLAMLRCRPGAATLLHRRYAARGYAAFLIETSPNTGLSAKHRIYDSAVLAAIEAAAASETDVSQLSPASEGFCLSLVRSYLVPPPVELPHDGHLAHTAALLAAALCLLAWMAKSPPRVSEGEWSRRFRKCVVDESMTSSPISPRRGLRPLTLRSWANRRVRLRYVEQPRRIESPTASGLFADGGMGLGTRSAPTSGTT